MGKRKQTVPQKATEEKRKCLTWNMLENQPGVSKIQPDLTLINDDDPRLLEEFEEAEKLKKQQKQDNITKTSLVSYANDEIADIFNLHLESCLFYVSVFRKPKLKLGEWSCHLGEFKVTFLPELNVIPVPQDSLPEVGDCWLYVGIHEGKSLLYYEIPDGQETPPQKSKKKKLQEKKQILFWNVDISLSIETMEALKCNVFQVVIEEYDCKTLTVSLKIIATEASLSVLSFVSEGERPKKQNQAITTLMDQFYGIKPPCYEDLKYNKKHDIDQLYIEIKAKHLEENHTILPNIQHPSFRPQLRLYQQEAISWMVETEKQNTKLEPKDSISESGNLHILYTEITTRDNQKLYYNKYGGLLVRKKPCSVKAPPAGILGDEMGLGKTVEVLGCMLHHPRKNVPKPEKLPVIVDDIKGGDKKKKKKEKIPRKKKGKIMKEDENADKLKKSSVDEHDSDTGSTIIYSNHTETEVFDEPDLKFKVSDIQRNKTKGSKDQEKSDDLVPSTSTEECSQESLTSQSIYHVGTSNVKRSGDFLSPIPSKQSGNSIKLYDSGLGESSFEESSNQSNGREQCEDIGLSQSNIRSSDHTLVKMKPQVSEFSETGNEKSRKTADVETLSQSVSVSDQLQNETNDTVDDGLQENEPDSFDEIKCLSNKDNVNSSCQGGKKSAGSNVMKRKLSDSGANATQVDVRPQRNIFTEMPASQRECFECNCGATEAAATKKDAKKHPVQCVKCSLWQHAECVNYDLKDVYRGEFMCPHCHVSSPPVISGATLIISPASIAHQWVEEILKHVVQASLNVFMYTGVYKQGFIQPQTLAQQDIVITTYETLRKEIDYVDLPHNNSATGRKLRYPKRFMAIPSPIIAVEWWRICLDEAQMVECTTTKTAEMALRLSGVNRWCVTGTPIQKGVEDLYGLLLFLGIDPFWVQQWWNKLIYVPFCYGIKQPMHDLLTSVLWRTMKKDVLDQINIPKQTEHINWLTFSPVEDHFYRRQYKECSRLAMERLSKFTERSTRLSKLDRYTINQLLYPLLRLRQACCHPQAVRGEFLPIHKSTMTMEQLLESLTKKAKLEAEESHRALVAAINGQAGLDIIDQKFVDAVDKYRDVLRSVEEHKNQLHTDSLQQLHAMYNLNEILSSKPEGVDPTLRDEQLPTQITELKDKYMAKAIAYVTSTGEALEPVQLDVKSCQQQLEEGSEWWLDVIEWVVNRDQQDLLIEKVKDDLLDNRNPEINSIARSIRTVAGLEYIVETHLSSLNTAYEKVLDAMKGLRGQPSLELINKTVECCLRPVGEILKTCPFCKSEVLFEAYESKLFSFVDKGIVVNEGPGTSGQLQVNTKRQGTWADSEVEKALKSILAFARTYRAEEDLIEYGTTHLKLFDALKKEYKKLRTHWAGIKEHVSTFDELDMATTTLRVRLPDEPKPDTPQPNILEPSEIGHHRLKLVSDKIVSEGELRKKLGQLLYLKNLEKSQMEGPGGENPEPCPICQQELGREWSVMQCGHCFCIDCIRIVVDRYSFGGRHRTVKCAVCRQSSSHGEISYVTTSGSPDTEDEAALRVKGSHSTKVEAVVRCLLKIKHDDPTAKALVFSTWVDVLSVIATALSENGVEHRALYTPGKFQAHLSSFKQDEEVTALLLPVHSGANGLNLIEATHVLLVEPVLNPAQELQAIGRVHRIGQTKPTQVHRFLIRGTIEQKMQSLLESMDVKATTKNAEENALTIGDLVSLFAQQVETQEEDSFIADAGSQVEIDGGTDAIVDSQVEVEDIVENVEISTDGIQGPDNVPCQEIGICQLVVNTDELIETGHENNESDTQIISSGSSDENDHMDEEYDSFDKTSDRYSFYGECSNSDNEYDRFEDFERYTDEDDYDSTHNSDDETSDLNVKMESSHIFKDQSIDLVGESVDVQPDVEVDDIIAMNEVDTVIINIDSTEEMAVHNREVLDEVTSATSHSDKEVIQIPVKEALEEKPEVVDSKTNIIMPIPYIEILDEVNNDIIHTDPNAGMLVPVIEIPDEIDAEVIPTNNNMQESVIEILDEPDTMVLHNVASDGKPKPVIEILDEAHMDVVCTYNKDKMPVPVIEIDTEADNEVIDTNNSDCRSVLATEILVDADNETIDPYATNDSNSVTASRTLSDANREAFHADSNDFTPAPNTEVLDDADNEAVHTDILESTPVTAGPVLDNVDSEVAQNGSNDSIVGPARPILNQVDSEVVHTNTIDSRSAREVLDEVD